MNENIIVKNTSIETIIEHLIECDIIYSIGFIPATIDLGLCDKEYKILIKPKKCLFSYHNY